MRPLWLGGIIAPVFAPLMFFLVVLLWSVATGGVAAGLHDWQAGVSSAVIFVLPMSYLATWLIGMPYLYWLQRKSQLYTLRVCAVAIASGVITTWVFQFIGRVAPLNWIVLSYGALIGGALAVCVALPICWIIGVSTRH
jgi:hypothetical protein